jgi:hypothetical protein
MKKLFHRLCLFMPWQRAAAIVLPFAVLVPAVPVFAQTTAAPSTTIDFSGFVLNIVLPSVASALGVLLLWVVQRFGGSIGQQNADVVRGYLNDAMQYALGFAHSKLGPGAISVDVKSPFIAEAVQFVLDHVPDAVKFFGLDQQSLAKLLAARLQVNLNATGTPTPATTSTLPAAPAPAPAATGAAA